MGDSTANKTTVNTFFIISPFIGFRLVPAALNNDLVSNVYVGDDKKLHVVKGGADTVLPFNSGIDKIYSFGGWLSTSNFTYILPATGKTLTVKFTNAGNAGQLRIVGADSTTETPNVNKILATLVAGETKTVDISKYPYWGVYSGGSAGYCNYEITINL